MIPINETGRDASAYFRADDRGHLKNPIHYGWISACGTLHWNEALDTENTSSGLIALGLNTQKPKRAILRTVGFEATDTNLKPPLAPECSRHMPAVSTWPATLRSCMASKKNDYNEKDITTLIGQFRGYSALWGYEANPWSFGYQVGKAYKPAKPANQKG